MIPPDEPEGASVAEAISDGQPVAWDAVASGPMADASPALMAEFKVLAALAELHRSRDPAGHHGRASEASTSEGSSRPRWGQFELLEEVGHGSFGTVHRAWDAQLAREVALKLIQPRGRSDRAHRKTLKEGQILAKVRHSNVITVFGAEVIDGVIGIWMEFLRGRTLQQELNERGALGAREAALVGIEVNRALAAVHKANLVHRDVKAQNVMREEGGRIVLMDFGAGVDNVDLAERVSMMGTPLYMAPELFHDAPATPASDRYSLGVLLYHLVTNEFPIHAPTVGQLKAAHEAGRQRRLRDVRPDLPASFIKAVEGATESAPANRTPTAAAFEEDLERVIRSEASDLRVPGQSRRTSWLMVMGMVLVLAAVSLFTWRDALFVRPPAVAEIRSLAVLPFANLSGQAEQDYVADAFTDLLITQLGRLSSVRIISRTSVMNYKGQKQPLSTIAGILHVDGLIEGSISRSGDRLRISVQLLRPDETRVWGQTYERPSADLFRIQSEISGVIVDALKLSLTPTEKASVTAAPMIREQAQNAFLRGLQRVNMTDNLQLALEDLLEAVRLDPSSARAHATLSQCYLLLGTREFMPRNEAYPLALKAATRAVQLDPSVAEAHTELAEVKFYYEWDWETARSEYEQALALNPNGSHAMARYSLYLSALDRRDDALHYAVAAQNLDPLSATVRFAPGMALFYAKRYDDAIAAFQALTKVPPYSLSASDHVGLARAYAEMKRFPEAVNEIQQAIALNGPIAPWTAELARIQAVSGHSAEARQLLAELQASAKAPAPANLAFVYAALGDHDRAFAELDRAVDMRSAALLWANVDPRLDPLRTDSRFQTLILKIGLH